MYYRNKIRKKIGITNSVGKYFGFIFNGSFDTFRNPDEYLAHNNINSSSEKQVKVEKILIL